MIFVNSDHPPGIVGITSGDLTRYTEFVASVQNMMVPMFTVAAWEKGYDICVNRNNIIRAALADKQFQWVFLTDDDHIWDGDILMNLLERNVDVVAPLVSMRTPPFHAISLEPAGPGWCKGSKWRPWRDIALTGLQETHVIGGAGLLIRRHVLEKLEDHWFNPGQLDPGHMQEDTEFSRKVIEAGFKIWVDSDNKIGHLTTCSVWPAPPDGIDVRFDFARTNIHIDLSKQEKWTR